MGRVLLAGATLAACRVGPARRGRTVIYASGADLQSINPLFTSHPLAKQVQRYVLLTTLARYDSALVPQPYLARRWTWSADRTTLTFRLQPGVRWHDGIPTTARDVAWTLNSAKRRGTRSRWETGRSGSWRTNRTGAGRSPRIRPFPWRWVVPRGSTASSWSWWTSPPPSSPRSPPGKSTSPGSCPRTQPSCAEAPTSPCSTTR